MIQINAGVSVATYERNKAALEEKRKKQKQYNAARKSILVAGKLKYGGKWIYLHRLSTFQREKVVHEAACAASGYKSNLSEVIKRIVPVASSKHQICTIL